MRRRKGAHPAQVSLDALFEADPPPVSDRSDTGVSASTLLDLIPNGARIAAVFRLVGIAEDVLAEMGDPGGVFQACFPTPVLVTYGSDLLFAAHVRELVLRQCVGGQAGPATKAEMIAGMMLTGLRAPLRSGAIAFVVSMVEDVLPSIAEQARGTWPDREEWPGQLAEQLAEARRRLAAPDRAFGDRFADASGVRSAACSGTSGSKSTSTRRPARTVRRASGRSTT